MKKNYLIPFLRVKSFKGLFAGIVYETTNYSMFKHANLNRASKLGYDPKKVKEYVALLHNKKFYYDLQHISVNLDGIVWEGNNRLRAFIEYAEKTGKKPVLRFLINDSSAINKVSDKALLKVLINFNGVRTEWKRNQLFDSAMELGLPVAHAMFKYIVEITNKYEHITKGKMQPSKLFGLIKKDYSMLHGNKITLDDLENIEFLKIMSSDEFKSDLSFSMAILNLLYDPAVTNCLSEAREVLKNILEYVWDYDLSKKKIYTYIKRHGFECGKLRPNRIERLDIINRKIIHKPESWEDLINWTDIATWE